jgi:hypothetical protein
MTPYNAQATIFFPSGYWSLYLPVTVAGRVSDIWRSYFAQALFKRIGVDFGFLPRPIVVQDRNPHSYEADFQAEIPLYTKGSALISYLLKNYVLNQNYTSESFIETLELLWIDMYEREYIEQEDVKNLQRWISALLKVGYQFPNLRPPLLPPKFANRKNTVIYNIKEILETRDDLAKIGHKINRINISVDFEIRSKLCDNSKHHVVFGTSDLHDGPRTDMSSVLAHLNQTFVHVGPRKLSQNYPEILQLPRVKKFLGPDSPVLMKYNDHSTKMDRRWPRWNTKWYLQRNLLKFVDAYICTFPASMCQIWIPMNKSIIFLPAHRYNLGRCTVKEWHQLDNEIIKLHSASENGDGGHTIGAVARYDIEYLKYYTGIQATLVPSYSGLYFDNNLYKGDNKKILIFCYDSRAFVNRVKETLLPEFSADQVYDVYTPYTPEALGRHQAIISLPYSVMSYRTTELYALGVPLFIPSIKFYMNYYNEKYKRFGFGSDRTMTTPPYCKSNPELEHKTRPKIGSPNSIHPYSPNVEILEDVESENYWLQFADFYDWPHIQYFDDYEHLKKLLIETNFAAVHSAMKKELLIKKDKVVNAWCDIIRRVDKHKNSYN